MKTTFSLLALLVLLPSVRGDMAPIVSYKQELVKGKYLLVMLYPEENTMNRDSPLNKKYPQSGLYLNDGSVKPIWTVAHPFMGQVFLSPDGDFLANVVFPCESSGDGICFYHKGKLLRAYKVKDLARPEHIQEACPSCIWHGKVDFKEAEQAVVLESHDGRVWHFELRTGKAVVQNDPKANLVRNEADGRELLMSGGLGAGWIVGLLAAVILGLGMGGFFLWKFGVFSKEQHFQSNQ